MIRTNRLASARGGGIRLEQYRANVHSQSGEDGMIRRALQVFPDLQKWCVEFGAWDGRFYSNTHRLIEFNLSIPNEIDFVQQPTTPYTRVIPRRPSAPWEAERL